MKNFKSLASPLAEEAVCSLNLSKSTKIDFLSTRPINERSTAQSGDCWPFVGKRCLLTAYQTYG